MNVCFLQASLWVCTGFLTHATKLKMMFRSTNLASIQQVLCLTDSKNIRHIDIMSVEEFKVLYFNPPRNENQDTTTQNIARCAIELTLHAWYTYPRGWIQNTVAQSIKVTHNTTHYKTYSSNINYPVFINIYTAASWTQQNMTFFTVFQRLPLYSLTFKFQQSYSRLAALHSSGTPNKND